MAVTIIVMLASTAKAADPEPDPVVCVQHRAMSRADVAVLEEVNRARQSPREYASIVQVVFQTMDAVGVYERGGRKVSTREGQSAVDEAIRFLLVMEPAPPLEMASCLNTAAARHAKAKGSIGRFGHDGITGTTPSSRASSLTNRAVACVENIGYGFSDVTELVAGLIVDDSVADRGHRNNIFDHRLKSFGSGSAGHLLRKTIDVHLLCMEEIDEPMD